MTREEFGELYEYSSSFPTEIIFGKKWKRKVYHIERYFSAHVENANKNKPMPFYWIMGYYYDSKNEGKKVIIGWRKIQVVDKLENIEFSK